MTYIACIMAIIDSVYVKFTIKEAILAAGYVTIAGRLVVVRVDHGSVHFINLSGNMMSKIELEGIPGPITHAVIDSRSQNVLFITKYPYFFGGIQRRANRYEVTTRDSTNDYVKDYIGGNALNSR